MRKRYRLKLDVTAEKQYLSITLFDAAQYFFDCDVKQYVHSTSEKKEESEYYRKLVLSKGKEFSILVKVDRNFPKVETNMNVIAMEIHEVEKKFTIDETKVVAPIKKQRSQRTKKAKVDSVQQHQMIGKMKGIAAEIPQAEKEITTVETENVSSEMTQRCKRTKKVKEATVVKHPILDNMNTIVAGIHEVENHNGPDESDDETPIIHLQRKRTRKVTQKKTKPHPMKQNIKVEKN